MADLDTFLSAMDYRARRDYLNMARALGENGVRKYCNAIDIKLPVRLSMIMLSDGMSPSLSEARRKIKQGGVYVNGKAVNNDVAVTRDMLLDNWLLIVELGKGGLNSCWLICKEQHS